MKFLSLKFNLLKMFSVILDLEMKDNELVVQFSSFLKVTLEIDAVIIRASR